MRLSGGCKLEKIITGQAWQKLRIDYKLVRVGALERRNGGSVITLLMGMLGFVIIFILFALVWPFIKWALIIAGIALGLFIVIAFISGIVKEINKGKNK